MLQFDPNIGFSVDDVETVREQVRQEWINAFKAENTPELDTEPETPAGQLIDSQTASIVQKDSEILYLANQMNPLTAEGVFQDALGQIYFITRHPEIKSTATIRCTGLTGTVITVGAQIRSSFDNTLWQSIESGAIGDEGYADVVFECTTSGPISASANTLTKIVTIISGWDTATNPESATVGQNEETQGAFETRRYQSVALNSRSAASAVFARVSSLNDVIAVCVRENKKDKTVITDGVSLAPHSIYVSAVGGTNEEIAQAIYNSISSGCDYNGNTTVQITNINTGAIEQVTFDRPESSPIGVKIVVRENDNLPSDAESRIKTAVYNNFYGLSTDTIEGQPLVRVKMGDDLYASRFYISIQNEGVSEILSIQICAPASGQDWQDFIHIPINKNPTLDQSNITVEINETQSLARRLNR